MKFEDLFKPAVGSVRAQMQKTIDELNEEVKQLRLKLAKQSKVESQNAEMRAKIAELQHFLSPKP